MDSDSQVITSLSSPASQDFVAELGGKTQQAASAVFSWHWIRWVLLIVILAILGLNIFSYLGKSTDYAAAFVRKVLGPIARFFGYTLVDTSEKIIDTSITGTKFGVDIAESAVESVFDVAKAGLDKLDGAGPRRAAARKQRITNDVAPDYLSDFVKAPAANETSHNIQRGHGASKGGYCFVGQDRGFRTCIKVSEGEQCMSGDIFPTRDVCVNPSLRV
jgi:hypothetical protein